MAQPVHAVQGYAAIGDQKEGGGDAYWQNTHPTLNFVKGQTEYKAQEELTYDLKGRPAFSFVELDIPQGKAVLGDAGAMLWMDGAVRMETWCHGGCFDAWCRQCSGESCCQNKFHGPGKVTFGFETPGDMLPFAVAPGNGWIITSRSFIVGTDNCIVSSRWSGCGAWCCGGEGMFTTKVISNGQGNGMFFAGSYGSIERHDVPQGKVLFVAGSLFFAAHESTDIEIGMPSGCCTLCFGGDGWIMKFQGPAVVYTQSRDPRIFDAPIEIPIDLELVLDIVSALAK